MYVKNCIRESDKIVIVSSNKLSNDTNVKRWTGALDYSVVPSNIQQDSRIILSSAGSTRIRVWNQINILVSYNNSRMKIFYIVYNQHVRSDTWRLYIVNNFITVTIRLWYFIVNLSKWWNKSLHNLRNRGRLRKRCLLRGSALYQRPFVEVRNNICDIRIYLEVKIQPTFILNVLIQIHMCGISM